MGRGVSSESATVVTHDLPQISPRAMLSLVGGMTWAVHLDAICGRRRKIRQLDEEERLTVTLYLGLNGV